MKGILLMSSGIDSPVAGYMMLRKGVELVVVHFDNQPLVDGKPVEMAKKLVKNLSEIAGKPIKMYIVPHGNTQKELALKANRRYTCVLCKRMMLRIAEMVAKKENADFLITGDSLGQVASQTLPNMAAVQEAVSIQVLRPVLCRDKVETMAIARSIGTYELSIQAKSCCGALPSNPATKSGIEKVKEEEGKLNIADIAAKAMNSAEVLEI